VAPGKSKFEIDMSKSLLIGDKFSDIMAGVNLGVNINILIDIARDADYCLDADAVYGSLREFLIASSEFLINI